MEAERSTMTVDQIKQEKDQLGYRIVRLLEEFKEKTGAHPESINLDYEEPFGYSAYVKVIV